MCEKECCCYCDCGNGKRDPEDELFQVAISGSSIQHKPGTDPDDFEGVDVARKSEELEDEEQRVQNGPGIFTRIVRWLG